MEIIKYILPKSPRMKILIAFVGLSLAALYIMPSPNTKTRPSLGNEKNLTQSDDTPQKTANTDSRIGTATQGGLTYLDIFSQNDHDFWDNMSKYECLSFDSNTFEYTAYDGCVELVNVDGKLNIIQNSHQGQHRLISLLNPDQCKDQKLLLIPSDFSGDQIANLLENNGYQRDSFKVDGYHFTSPISSNAPENYSGLINGGAVCLQ